VLKRIGTGMGVGPEIERKEKRVKVNECSPLKKYYGMTHPSEETERRCKMNRFLIISLAFIVIMFVGLSYAYELKEVAKEAIVDLETVELTEEEEETGGSWIEIELVDDEDEAISSESYEIVAPDGSTIGEGSLDENADEEEETEDSSFNYEEIDFDYSEMQHDTGDSDDVETSWEVDEAEE
jgi:hypothetical protein